MKQLTHNQAKEIRSLRSNKGNKETGLFLVEGWKNCEELLNSKVMPRYVVLREDAPIDDYVWKLAERLSNVSKQDLFVAKSSVFDSLCDAVTPQDIIVAAEIPNRSLIDIKRPCVVLDNIQDPGNMGTIIRTADWFGYSQILLLGECANVYSPKVVRSTMGSLFRIQFSSCKVHFSRYFKKELQGMKMFAATSNEVKGVMDIKDLTLPAAYGIVIGNEAHGISPEIAELIDTWFTIPGSGRAESLNAGIAAGIAMYVLSGV